MAHYKSDMADIDLSTGTIFRSFLNRTIGYKDDDADRFGVRVFRDGAPQDLSGASCQAVFMAPDGTKIALTSYGTVSSNEAYVTLPPACYDAEGQFTLAIKLVGGGVTSTVRIVDGVVVNTGASGTVSPTGAVPTYQEIIAQFDEMVAATEAANAAIAETFDAEDEYPVGKYVINDGGLYILPNGHEEDETWADTTKVACRLGDEFTNIKNIVGELYEYYNDFVMIKERTYNSAGTITTNNAFSYAVSSYFSCAYIVSETPVKDSDNVDLSVYVVEWDAEGIYLGRTELEKGVGYYPRVDMAYMSVIFGRASSTGITISNYDINNYLKVKTIRSMTSAQIENGEVQFGNLQTIQGSLNTNYTFVTSAATAYVLKFQKTLFDEAERKYRIRVTANSNSGCVFAFLNTDIITPQTVVYDGTDVAAGESADKDIPQMTKNIIISRSNTSGTDKTPTEFVIEEVTDEVENENSVTLAEVANYGLAFSGDYDDMSDYDSARISSAGYNPASGFSNKVTINRCVVCDTISIKALVHFNNTTNVSLTLGTVDAGFTSSKHATIVKFDFANARVDFMAGASGGGNYDGTTMPGYVYDSFDLENISGYMYTVEIGRISRCPYARVWNRKTGKLCGEKILTEYATSESYGGKAGALYDYPTFSALSDNVYFERIVIAAPANPFAAFVGDSITEGSQVSVSDAWAGRACKYLGKSINCGRGGGNIDNAQKCVDGILAAIKPKYVFVTIGTNGGNTETKLNNLISTIKAFGATPVINCITMKTTSVESVNEQILATNAEHCRFDYATAVNNDPSQGQNASLFNSDNLHPNAAGHMAMYKEWLTNFSNIKAE